MPINTTATYSPASGYDNVSLSGSIKSDAQFSTQPVAGDQIVFEDAITIGADLTVYGSSGSYDVWHIIATTGAIEKVIYGISTSGSVTYSPQAGHSVVTLSGTLPTDTQFATQPVSGDQIVYPDALTVSSALSISGSSGTYTLWHIKLDGTAVKTQYLIGTTVGAGTAIYSAGSAYTTATLEVGFDAYIFEGWSPQPVAGEQITTLTTDGYVTNAGDYISEKEHVHSAWFTALDGTTTKFNIDSILGVGVNLTPTAFVFSPLSDQPLSTNVESNTITVSGITSGYSVPISISLGGSYSISKDNGVTFSAYTSAEGEVVLGDVVKIRQTTSSSFLTGSTITLTISNVSSQWTVTTSAGVPVSPSQFVFVDKTGASLSTVYESNEIIISGITPGVAAPISVTGGEYAIKPAGSSVYGSYTSSSGSVYLGDSVKVRGTSSGSYSTQVNVSLLVVSTSDEFSITTTAVDNTPEGLTFTDLINIDTSTEIESAGVQVTGMSAGYPASISVIGGSYAISTDGGTTYSSYTSTAGTIQNGSYLKLKVTTSANYYTKSSVTVTVGTYSTTWSATTLSLSIPQFNVNDPSVIVERFFGDSYRARINKGYDNWVKFELYNDGSVMNLSNATDYKVILTNNEGTEYSITRNVSPNYFSISPDLGVIDVMIGMMDAPVGNYNLDLIYYDARHTNGAVMTKDRQIIIEMI